MAFRAMRLGLMSRSAEPLVLTYRGTVALAAENNQPQTFSAVPIGDASQRAEVILVIGALRNSGKVISAVTIGGVSAALDTVNTDAGNVGGTMAIARAQVPSGTTADVVVTGGFTELFYGQVAAYTVNRLVTVTDSDFTNGNTSSVLTSAISTSAGGVIVAGTQQRNGSQASTPSGWTSDVNNDWNSDEWFQSISRTTDGTSLTPNITGLSNAGGVAVAYGPA